MKPSRKHKTLSVQGDKGDNRQLREEIRRQNIELEKKDRELEIEASLERVRARAMAMQSSSELADLIAMIHSELSRLDKNLDRCFIILFDNKDNSIWWMAGNDAMRLKRGYYLPNNMYSPYLAILQGWKKKKARWGYVLTGAFKKRWDNFIFSKTEFAQFSKAVKAHMTGFKVAILDASFNRYGGILSGSYEPLTSRSVDLLVRFSRMFEQTYTRFLDLQKAELQAREAQIEAALEKVRSASLAMHHSDELENVAVVLFDKLEELGLAFDAALISIFDRENRSFHSWIASHVESPVKINMPYDARMAKNRVVKDLWRATEEVEDIFNKAYSGKTKDDYIMFLQRHNGSKISKSIKALMLKAKNWTVSFAAEKNSLVGVDSWSGQLTSEQDFNILKRFSKVFEQAYTRFLDLQKAEAQTRESQIQLALERVRARTMAMQRSDELQGASNLLFKQVNSLGIPVWCCGFNIWEKGEKVCTGWMSSNDIIQPPFRIPLTESPTFIRFYKSRQKNEDFYVEEVGGKELKAHYKYMFNLPDFTKIGNEHLKAGFSLPESQINHTVNFAHGNLVFITKEPVPGAWDIFKRFAKVFEQTYTRFLDLQKAEAQVREAKIEAALEKIRSRTMGMQRSNELADVAALLFQQVRALGVQLWSCGFSIWHKGDKEFTAWMSTPEGRLAPPTKILLSEHPYFVRFEESRRKGIDFWVLERSGKELADFYRYLASLDVSGTGLKAHLDSGGQHPTRQFDHVVNFLHGNLIFITYDPYPEAHDIFRRFGKVFEQTYTRFLDLEKAEAQAQEARIEAALEKVRSRSMGMQKSGELREVVATVYQQLQNLGFNVNFCNIVLFDPISLDATYWISFDDLKISPEGYHIPYSNHPLFQYQLNTWRNQEAFAAYDLSGKLKATWDKYIADLPDVRMLPASLIKKIQRIRKLTLVSVATKSGLMQTGGTESPSSETVAILQRFAKVFDQSYTRFLDLQKAEAQARESQIQLALERVRARTMAMHESSELAEVAVLLFEQLRQLGASLWVCGFNICDKDSEIVEGWASPPDGKVMEPLYVPNSVEPFQRAAYDCWKNGGEIHSDQVEGEELRIGHEALLAHPSMKGPRDHLKEKKIPMPTWVQRHAAIHKYGFLQVVVTQPFDEVQIIVRFAKVFEQTYTRFLDLKNVEAQARESQIQLALERVRARTMAMQKSDELKEVASLLFAQVKALGITCWTTGFNIWSDDGDSYVDYVTNPVGEFMEPYTVDTTRHPLLADVAVSRRRGDTFHVQFESGEDIIKTYQYLQEFGDKKQFQKILDSGFQFPSQQVDHFVFGSKTSLLFITYDQVPEAHDIFKRFGKAFEQTYTRFLDLQNAETQVRESQVQLALERVRARTMAMQKSEELSEVSVLLFEQLRQLGTAMWVSGFSICKDDTTIVEKWMTRPDGNVMDTLYLAYPDDPGETSAYNAWKNGEELYMLELNADDIRKGHEHYASLPSTKIIIQRLEELGLSLPMWGKIHIAPYKQGYLSVVTTEPFEETQIFVRFAKVFEQTYTRFLDLKTAEAQTRESQIQLALERVRARTMAMQKSEELNDVAILLYQQVTQLSIKVWTTGFNVWNEDNSSYTDYITSPQGNAIEAYTIDATKFPVFIEVADARKSGVEFWVQSLEGDLLKETYKELTKFDEQQYNKMLSDGYQFPSRQYDHFVFGSKVSLMFITYEPVPEAHDIFKRFGKVFEQTYTRFLDLQKAEAQAREAQIEAALEKIRSRSLAMHHSEELREVITVCFEKLNELGILLGTVGIALFDPKSKNIFYWVGNSIQDPQYVHVPYNEVIMRSENFIRDSWTAMDEKRELVNKIYTKTQKETFFDHLFSSNDLETIPESAREVLRAMDTHTVCFFPNTNSSLFADSWDGRKYSDDGINILRRAGRVFDQAYVRFLDLQKAEAQAREAQIENALEKVRSTSLAMHHSDELEKVVHVLLEKLIDLGLHFDGAGINVFDKEKRSFQVWVATKFLSTPIRVNVPYDKEIEDNKIVQDLWHALETGDHVFNRSYSGKDKDDYFRFVAKHNESKIPEEVTKANLAAVSWTVTFTAEKNSVIAFDSWSGQTTSVVDFQILKRFSRVFEQAYVRFLDLKRSEAQVREAEIQLALERVRARTMAMQQSNELLEISSVLVKQVLNLGIKTWGCAFNIFDEGQNSSTEWFTNEQGYQSTYKIPREGVFLRYYEAAQKGVPVYVEEFNEQACIEHYKFLSTLPGLDEEMKTYVAEGIPLPARQFDNAAFFKYGYILFVTYEDVSPEHYILIRFAKEFEQTYTRFLDLQKAEAQAREAQIEAALERLRSRTMAMQRSSELTEVSQLLHQQFLSLGVQTITCAFMFPNEEKMMQSGWTVLPDGTLLPQVLDFPLVGDDVLNERYDGWKEKRPLHRRTLQREENRRHHQFLSERVSSVISKNVFTQLPPEKLTFTNANFAQGYVMTFTNDVLTSEEENILMRFAKVFEQTYTRFLDLQKAEIQARESRIQLALERVRARTMAMHVSNEVRDVAKTISDQLRELGFEGNCTIALIDGGTGDMELWMGSFDEERFLKSYIIRNFDHPVHREIVDGFNHGEKFKSIHASAELKKSYDANLFYENGFKDVPDDIKSWMMSVETGDFSYAYNKHGALYCAPFPITEEQASILQRFATVFEQTYTRFLDLQKAEAQARESQIEAALERVRARAMAMHTTQELKEVVHELRRQIGMLGAKDLDTVAIHLNDESPDFVRAWAGSRLSEHDDIKEFVVDFPKKGLTVIEEALEFYYKGERDYQIASDSAKLKQWWEFVFSKLPDAREFFAGTPATDETLTHFWSLADFQGGSLVMATIGRPEQDSLALLRRFSNVFGLAYRRFADLKQAEAQAREAQIEAALERVRSQAMAMHTAQQLKDVVHELRKQMGLLGQKDLETCGIHLNDESPEFIHAWAASRLANRNDEILESNLMIPKRGLAIIEETIEAYSAGRIDYVIPINSTKLNEWLEFMREAAPKAYSLIVESTKRAGHGMKNAAFWSLADFQGGSLIMVTLETPDETSRALLRRFANVFGLAYRRFADLKQAEAQAREATIEAALEKIRSRSLGMHRSEEIKDVVAILFHKLKELGLVFDGGAAIQLFSEGSKDAVIWVMSPLGEEPICNDLPFDSEMDGNSPIYYDMRRAKDTGTHIINRHYSFEQKNKYFEYIFKHNDFVKLPQETRDFILDARAYSATFIAEKNSLLGASSWTEQEFSENDVDVLKRVARVFEQAYIRFLDLQKAEAQAREATIEAALEKIRSRSLGMHRSEEIKNVVTILYEKLKELGLIFDGGAGIHTFSEGTRDSVMWVLGTDHNISVRNNHPYDEHYEHNPVLRDIWKAKDTGEHVINRHYTFEEKNEFFEYISKHNDATKVPETLRMAVANAPGYTATFIAEKNSLLTADSFSGQTFSTNDVEVLKRVARVFDQAYVRFLDLQKVEIHAKEAIRQASLDRVRAEIASMRTVEDLDRITPLIWSELTALNIPFIRCGVFIMDEQNRMVHNFLSTPDGKAIAVFQLPFDTPGFAGDIVRNWLARKVYVDYRDDQSMQDFANILVERGIFASAEQYLKTIPKGGFYMHLLPFRQGMLYVGNLIQLKEEELDTLQLLADAFATAYARYDDFNRLEQAKKQVDIALINLKQAQQQLVQSEKMASLGELTAGIAHEIQNPLNFVNNFSEVSHELMDEIKAEIEAGNLQAATDLVNNIKQNLEKITHHGKRADGIVKGMLQHSRTGSGQKEPTNLNVLCDEYVRLAYHGYRAKDKTFNAKFETDFDSNLPKVSVIAQDIGRVILNLINNAFYAVNEKGKVEGTGYSPLVTISTKRWDHRVEIRVRDNGNGIPETIREKIFQPFFTTKPTGQGTGLGLSLAYDIVTKLHGGELKLETKPGEGSEFIVTIPNTK